MKYIVVDLEMNPIKKEHVYEKQICRNETIEIGAVVLDEEYKEVDSFVTFVQPKFNTGITEHITKLTGITTEQVQNAPCFHMALQMFFDWCNALQDDIVFLQWSDNDYEQLTKEMLLKQIELTDRQAENFANWKDFQQEFGELLGLERRISLENALRYADYDFAGCHHDAIDDARNTALLVKTVYTPELRIKALDRVINVLKPESFSSMLGDLFDFGAMCITG